jgi:hypothetical protein
VKILYSCECCGETAETKQEMGEHEEQCKKGYGVCVRCGSALFLLAARMNEKTDTVTFVLVCRSCKKEHGEYDFPYFVRGNP